MSERVLTTPMNSSRLLALPRGLVMAFDRARALLPRASEIIDQPAPEYDATTHFPAAIGATDRELARLGRRDDPEEFLRRAKSYAGLRRGRF